MKEKYYDVTEGDFMDGKWLDGGDGVLPQSDSRTRQHSSSSSGGRMHFNKRFTIHLSPGSWGAPPRAHKDYYNFRSSPGSSPTFNFSDTEKRHLLVAGLALTVAFIIFLSHHNKTGLSSILSGQHFPLLLSGALVAVLTGFLSHEMAHKFAAQKMGYWAEFRYSSSGLFMAIVLSFIGFLIAAPGAVYIRGNLSRRENGIISLAGPATNSLWATLFLVAFQVMRLLEFSDAGLVAGILWTIVIYGFIINAIFAAFNLLPLRFLNLDGYKILRWNPTIYGIFCSVVGLYVLTIFGVIGVIPGF